MAPVHGPRKMFEADARAPVQITRQAWNHVMDRLNKLECRVTELEVGGDDIA